MKKKTKNKRSLTKLRHEVVDVRDGDGVHSLTAFSGPIPPASELAKYEDAIPGSADRIIAMAEKQLAHIHDSERAIIHSNIRNERISMWLAFILTLSLMALGFYLILNDKSIAGYFAVFGPVIFHAGNYLYNKKREKEHIER